MNKAYIFLAPGFEEIEALTPVDLLRRAGIETVTVAVAPTQIVEGAHGIQVVADAMLSDVVKEAADAVLLVAPGGMPGAKNLADSAELCRLFTAQNRRGALVAAICAAPAVVLAPLGILEEKDATCYPGFEEAIAAGGGRHMKQRTVRSANVITANGPSSAIPFALNLIKAVKNQDEADRIATQILL